MKITSFHRTLLLLAGLLLSLHSLVPHVHGEHHVTSDEVMVKNIPGPTADLLSLLQNLFTDTDLGEDHLEHFAPSQDLAFDIDLTALQPPTAYPIIVLAPRVKTPVIRRQRVFRSRHFPPSGIYPDNAAPRGPPTLA